MTDKTTIVRLPIEQACSHSDCTELSDYAYIVTGEYGKDCIAGYCQQHSETFADKSNNHTAIAEVEA